MYTWIALISAKRWRLDVLTFLIHGFDKTYKMRTFECCLAFTHLARSFHQIQRGTPETTLYFVATLTHTGRIVVSRLEDNVVKSSLSFPEFFKSTFIPQSYTAKFFLVGNFCQQRLHVFLIDQLLKSTVYNYGGKQPV